LFDGRHILGNNLYAYCGNDPVNYVDSEGRYKIPAISKGEILLAYQRAEMKNPVPIYNAKYTEFSKGSDNAFTNAFALGLFELAVTQAIGAVKYLNNPKPMVSGEYGILQIQNEFTIISIPNQVMIIDWSVPVEVIKVYADAVFVTAGNSVAIIANKIAGLFRSWDASGSEYYDGNPTYYVARANEETWEWEELFVNDRSKALEILRNQFNYIKRTFDEFIIWVDYKAVYGKKVTSFWDQF
jgi:hypothetical protein